MGLLERGTHNLRLFVVTDRSKPTMNSIFTEHVKPGSTVFSDLWGGYNDLNSLGFNHIAINKAHCDH